MKPEQMAPLLDPEIYKMKPRYLARGTFDQDRVYCLVEKGSRDEVIRIMISTIDFSILSVEGIYESANSKLLTIEANPEHAAQVFVIDEEQRVTLLSDQKDADNNSKVTMLDQIDMSEHDADLHFDLLEQRPWSSVVINSRVMTIRDMNYSLHSTLTWK